MEPRFDFTDRARPIIELGIGDTRIPTGQAVWDTSLWDDPGALWAGTEPTWFDITCHAFSYRCEYGRARVTDRFVAGQATVLVSNVTGWADVDTVDAPNTLTVRPGRAIRMGVVHDTLGVRWLFRGFVDAVLPVYDPNDPDTVQLDCIDALGEVNRTKSVPLSSPVGAGETVSARMERLLDLADWPASKRDIEAGSTTLVASTFGGQLADMLSRSADSAGGSVFGDYEGRVAFRNRDWQTFVPGTPPDGAIGNTPSDAAVGNRVTFGDLNYLEDGEQVVDGYEVAVIEVCPTRWERPFSRADIATRVIVGRNGPVGGVGAAAGGYVQVDDLDAQVLYGIEPFERTDLLTESDTTLALLADRYLLTRGARTAPRVRSVSLDAATAADALDMMTSVDVYLPSRYRCRLTYPRGTVFDGEYFATGVAHEVTPKAWTLDMNLDVAAPFATTGDRWDSALWDWTTWADPVSDPIGVTA